MFRLGIACVLAITVALAPQPGALGTSGKAALAVIPQPVSLQALTSGPFRLTRATRIAAPPGAKAVGHYLARLLRRSTGFPVPVVTTGPAALALELAPSAGLGREGYRLEARSTGVRLRAATPEGLFRGIQTLRQLLPPKVEAGSAQPGPSEVPAVQITDRPRFQWRGAMLDVARHFFTVAEVKRYLDLLALYKINVLHLHLTDDQGWRIAIKSRPRLAAYGGGTETGGGPGGFYTQQDYREIVRYAAERFVAVVPEIDGPAHVTAALASYPELTCDGRPVPRQTLPIVFSSFCVRKEVTYRFLREVVAEVAALTPGPYFHLGGDETYLLTAREYATYLGRAVRIVRNTGKTVMGWHEAATTPLPRGSVVQYWGTASGSAAGTEPVRAAVKQGARLVMSPANRAYLDAKYHIGTPYGLFIPWMGFVDVRQAYEWDPVTLVSGVAEKDVLGVEAALWTEGVDGMEQLEFMAFPRLPGIAEVGWSRRATRSWHGYRSRLAAQAPRWRHLSVGYYPSVQVRWG